LWRTQIGGDEAKHLLRVVAERRDVRCIAQRKTAGERFALGENRPGVVADELR
jgi:hypothetical protein